MIDISSIDIRRIDQIGMYLNNYGTYTLLNYDQIVNLRRVHKTNDIAVRSGAPKIDFKKIKENLEEKTITFEFKKVKPILEDKKEELVVDINEIESKKKVKYSIDRSYKAKQFHAETDVKNLRKKGVPMFIASVGIVFTLVGGANLLNGVGYTQGNKPVVEVVDSSNSQYSDIESSLDNVSSNVNLSTITLPLYDSSESFNTDNNSGVDDITSEEVEEVVDPFLFKKETINEYCNVYGLDYNLVYGKLVEITDNFTSVDYLSGTIEGVKLKGEQVHDLSETQLLLLAVRSIYFNPEQYGFSENQICGPIDKVYLGVENDNSPTNIVDEYHEKIYHYAKIFGIDECLVHAMIQCESGYDSYNFKENHNPSGIMSGGKAIHYASDEIGLIETILQMFWEQYIMGAVTVKDFARIHNLGVFDLDVPDYELVNYKGYKEYIAWCELVDDIRQYAVRVRDEIFPVDKDFEMDNSNIVRGR